MKRRVVITGMGVVSPIGNDVEQVWDSVQHSRCGIDRITHFDAGDFRAKLAGEVRNLDMEQYFTKRDLKFNDRFTQFTRIAAKQAYENSGLQDTEFNRDRFGVIIGSGIGGISTIEGASQTIESRGPSRISPYFIPMSLINLAAGSAAIDMDAHGNVSSVVTACAAATNAIGEAFDAERKGFVMGEGAGVLILEELKHALARNAEIYGEVIGYGSTCDANHITAPLADGAQAARAMTMAIEDGAITAADVDYINAHGTSTPLNDASETLAVKKAFGAAAMKPYVSSTKSMSGHLLGASGALEAIISTLAVKNGFVPATINYRHADPACDLNLVVNEGKQADIRIAMSNSLGFGGHNASILIRRWEK